MMNFDYLEDKGFFNDDLSDNNCNQLHIEVVDGNINTSVVPSNKDRFRTIAAFLDNLECDDIGEIISKAIINLVIVGLISVAICDVEKAFPDSSEILNVVKNGIGVYIWLMTFWWIFEANVNNLRDAIIKNHFHIHRGQPIYFLHYNGYVDKADIESSYINDNEIFFSVKSGNDSFVLNEQHIFTNMDCAVRSKNEIFSMRINFLSSVMGLDKAKAFLNSSLFYKYSENYFNQKKINDDLHNYHYYNENFLTSEESFNEFCEFVKAEISKEEKNRKKEKEQEALKHKEISKNVETISKIMINKGEKIYEN